MESKQEDEKSKTVLKYSPIKISTLNINSDLRHSERVEDDELSENQVKSKAIVKYSTTYPVKFRKLDSNTNLNLPPINWLSTSVSPGFKNVLNEVLYGRSGEEFTSFRIAHMFSEYMGKVDVVADAEVIKNILKIPYFKGPVSVIVHRIANTLLIDNFDINKCLLRTPEGKEWDVLKRLLGNVLKSNGANNALYVKNRSRKKLQERSLVSKFLCYSVGNDNDEVGEDDFYVERPILSDPLPQETPDPYANVHQHNRNVYWTFESLRMLIGTDMPIFGQGIHPCISLRLHDMSKPISVLTGIDYWLDNLMCNVPEVAMCYHLNGVVQKYELIKTEDLPRLENSQFSSAAIRDIAKSILSFLKSNATKAGHTYWLFKPNNEDVVKLYDLTSLCSQSVPEKDGSPFIVPVAMLLYRVARSMKYSTDKQRSGVIRMLLENCIELLNPKRYPEIVSSSHYILSDLYIPFDTNPEFPTFKEEDGEEVFDDLPDNGDDNGDSTLRAMDSSQVSDYKSLPITDSVEERCLQALYHAAAGLDCLQYFANEAANGQKENQCKEEEIPMAKSFEPIPMPFHETQPTADLSKQGAVPKTKKKKKKEKAKKKKESEVTSSNTNVLLLKNNVEARPLPTWQDLNQDQTTWKQQLKIIFYEKAELVYATLSEQYYLGRNYGASLRSLGLLVRCNHIQSKLHCVSNSLVENSLLTKTADCCIMIVQTWADIDAHRKAYNTYLKQDDEIMKQMQKDERLYNIKYMESNLKGVFISQLLSVQQILLKAVDLYREALDYTECDDICGKLGNAYNELGKFFLKEARDTNNPAIIKDSCEKAEVYLKKGLEMFEKLKNTTNQALLYTNMGHLYRILARLETEKQNKSNEMTQYNTAFYNYKTALRVLGERSQSPPIWDTVTWELSTATFTMASHLYDSLDLSSSEDTTQSERACTKALQDALKCCDLNEAHPKFPLYQFRAGLINYNLGIIQCRSSLHLQNDAAKKGTHLAKLHFEKASKFFYELTDAVHYFAVQKEHLVLLEYLITSSSSGKVKMNYYQESLQLLLDTKIMLQLIVDKKADIGEDSTESDQPPLKTLLEILQTRIQNTLLGLLKLFNTPLKKQYPKLPDVYKQCYKFSLSLKKGDEFEIAQNMFEVLSKIETHLLIADAKS